MIILTSVMLGCTFSRSVEFSTESKFLSRDSSLKHLLGVVSLFGVDVTSK